jgi:plastocyanin
MHRTPFFRTPFAVLALAIALTAGLAACSPASSPEPSAAESAAGSTSAEVTTIVISGNSFGDDLTLPAGTVIVFRNDDGVGHTATEGEEGTAAADARFDFSLAAGQTSDQYTLEAGTYNVTCKIHSSMSLVITVE